MLTKFNFLDIWANLFRLDEMKIVCGNVLLIIEILLTTLFLNAMVEMVFSKRNCIKTDKVSNESRKTGKSVTYR